MIILIRLKSNTYTGGVHEKNIISTTNIFTNNYAYWMQWQ